MTVLSRVSGVQAGVACAEICVPDDERAPDRDVVIPRVERAARRFCVWAQMASLLLAAISAAGARAQSQAQYPNPPGGTPSAPASTPAPIAPSASSVNGVYQDAASGACDSKGGLSLNVGGFSPALCKEETTETTGTGAETKTTNTCFPEGGGDTLLVGQKGNTCYYCLPVNFPANLNVIVVPQDAGNAAYKQGFTCAVAESDGCYLTCDGAGPFTPPAGTTAMTPSEYGGKATSGQPQTQFQLHVSNTPDPCYPAGPQQYYVCDYPNLPRPAGCECSTAAKPPPAVPPTHGPAAPALQAASDFSDQMRAAAETMLQNAGAISKAMSDASDVRTHNNVGINIALMAQVGALGKIMTFVAQQYKVVAAANAAATAAQRAAELQIAQTAAAESGALASQAEQAAAAAGKGGAAPTGGPVGTPGGAPVNAPMGGGGGTNVPGDLPYQDDMLYLGQSALPSQGNLPLCGVLSCAQLANLLGKNVSVLEALDAVEVGALGSTPAQMVAGLQKMGVSAQMVAGPEAGAAISEMLTAGKPIIAGIHLWGPEGVPILPGSALHAVVIKAAQTVNGVKGFTIYDPAGWYYWQPVETFFNYATGVVVHAL